jgi:uncharacterized membrane protein YozB (DUF420 family)
MAEPIDEVGSRKQALIHRESSWYFNFISIVFGVFIAVWIEPITALFPVQKVGVESTLEVLNSLETIRGALMFLMLICLWWWYGTLLGRVAPAVGFWSYMYDFISLCSFAVAFRMWNHPSLFPMVVFFAAGLMLLRFWMASKKVEPGSKAKSAMKGAIFGTLLFLIMAISALIGAAVAMGLMENGDSTCYEGLQKVLSFVEYSILGLLVIGIGVTFYAVWITEGPSFENPIAPKVWMKKPGS